MKCQVIGWKGNQQGLIRKELEVTCLVVGCRITLSFEGISGEVELKKLTENGWEKGFEVWNDDGDNFLIYFFYSIVF